MTQGFAKKPKETPLVPRGGTDKVNSIDETTNELLQMLIFEQRITNIHLSIVTSGEFTTEDLT